MSLQIIFWISVGFVGLTYAGYPLAVWTLAAIFGKPVRKGDVDGSVSFIVAAHNEAGCISRRIENLLGQADVKIAEVVAGSDGSTDETESIVSGMTDPRVKLVAFVERRGKPAMLNACVAAATGDYLIFADARQTFAPDAAARLLENFADENVKCVSGELVIARSADGSVDAGLYWRYEKFIRRNESKLYSTIGATGAIYALRREDFVELPQDTLLDDVVVPLCAQCAGGRTVFEPRAVACDESAAPGREWSRKVRTLAGNFQLLFSPRRFGSPFAISTCVQFVGHKVARLIVPAAMVTTLVGTFGLDGALFGTLLGLQLVGYIGALIGWLLERTGKRVGRLGLPLTFVMLNLAVPVAFWRYLTGAQGVKWRHKGDSAAPRICGGGERHE